MASILIASVPIHGHVTPLLAVARHLVERGDDVRFLTGSRFATAVAATGARHIALTGDADYDDRVDHDALFPERAALRGIKAAAFDIENMFVRPASIQVEAVLATHAEKPVDVLLVDPTFTGAAFLLGYPRSARPAIVDCGVLPLAMSSPDVAPFGMGLPPARWGNRIRNTALTFATRGALAGVTELSNEIYRDLHGTDMPFPVMDWARRAEAVVQFTVASFEYPRADMPPTVHFAGPLSASGSSAPLPPWWGDLDGTRRIVHVTQGTIANKDYTQLIVPTAQALVDDDVLVVVSTGGRPVDTLPPLPANVRAAEYLPYDELLPRTDVFVTNGGYGGVQYALRHGVPIVATGGKEDKPEVGARVAWFSVGVQIRRDRPTVRALRRAVRRVLSDPDYRTASQRIATEMAASGGYRVLTDVVDDVARQAAVGLGCD
ncbi:glycosyltransferase [Mycobacterium sp. SMC-4]|uniref:glycosyltransferase n=1 Tax=Mycobacterium sp. SMC-4 TaxID=2857059 RepID=UPI0021B24735|nr:nucleotide disphospho-sugar-binding domain-containing protein [Mycobacterium sp. SMC-4]UXA18961.1 glycosyltransferase [Mycobacterium sp. SMC-4]